MTKKISFIINGKAKTALAEPDIMLVDYLREELNLTGTKKGCGKGECGACTVIMDGKAVNSCMVPIFKADGAVIETVEGLEKDGKLHPLQNAFIEEGAVQCGFCTPGMLMSAKALLDKNPNPSKEEIREALGGNICRCTGYVKIEQAVTTAAALMQEEQNSNNGGTE